MQVQTVSIGKLTYTFANLSHPSLIIVSRRRLVSNVLITFLNTPRGDTKRFEMLQLIASILSWTDDQREKVGLQRSSGGLSAPGVIASGSRGGGKGHARSGKTQAVDDGVENEVSLRVNDCFYYSGQLTLNLSSRQQSFSNLWIEFLLKESSQGASATNPASSKQAPTSPSLEFGGNGGPPSPFGGRFDLPSLGSPPRSTTSTRRPSLTSIFSNGSSTAQTSTAPPSIAEEEK